MSVALSVPRAVRLLVLSALASMTLLAAAPTAQAQDFAMTGGTQYFVVPAGVKSIVVTATGAAGSNGAGENGARGGYGGAGAVVVARIDVTPGETLKLVVGEGGRPSWKGGGGDAGYGDGFQGGVGGDGVLSYAGGAGGSATVVMRGNTVLLVAGGGGGGSGMGGDGITGRRSDGATGGAGGQNPQDGFHGDANRRGPGGKAGGFKPYTQGQAGGLGANIFFSAAGAGGGGGGGYWGGNGGGAGTTNFLEQGTPGGAGGAGANYTAAGVSGTVITTASQQPGANGAMSIDAARTSVTTLVTPSAQQGNNTDIPLRANVANWGPGQTVTFDYMDGRMPANIMRQHICTDVPVVAGVANCNFRMNVTGRYQIVATTTSTNAVVAGPEVYDSVQIVLNTALRFLDGDTVEGSRSNTLTVQVEGLTASIGSVNWRGVSGCNGAPVRDGHGRYVSSCTFPASDTPRDQTLIVDYTGQLEKSAGSTASKLIHFVVSRNTLSIPMAPAVGSINLGGAVKVQPILARPANNDNYAPNSAGEVVVTIAPNGTCDNGVKVAGRMTWTCRPAAPGQHTVTATWASSFSIRQWAPASGQKTVTYRPTATTSTFRTIGARARLVPDVTTSPTIVGVPFALDVHGYDSGDNDLGVATDPLATFSIAPDGACAASRCWAETTGDHVVTVRSGALSGTRTVAIAGSNDEGAFGWYITGPDNGFFPSGDPEVVPALTQVATTANRVFDVRGGMPVAGDPFGSSLSVRWLVDGAELVDFPSDCRAAQPQIDFIGRQLRDTCTISGASLAPGAHLLTAELSDDRGMKRAVARRIRVVGPATTLALTTPATVFPGQPATVGMSLQDATGFDLGAPAAPVLAMEGGECDQLARTCWSSDIRRHTITVTTSEGPSAFASVKVSIGGFYTQVQVAATRASIPVGGDPGFTLRGLDPDGDFVTNVAPGQQVWEREQFALNNWVAFDPYAANAFSTAGSQHLRVRGQVGGQAEISILVTAGTVDHYTFNVDTANGQTDAGTEYGMTVRAKDRFNNDLGDVTSQSTLMVSGGTCTTSRCTWFRSGTQTAMAVSPTGTILTFTRGINPGRALVLRLEPADATGSVVAGGTRTFRAISSDEYGNVIADVSADATFTFGGAACSGATCLATVAGSNVVDATYRVPNTGIDVSANLTAQVEAGPLASFTAAAARTTVVAGGDVTLTATGFDAFGNVVPGDITSAIDVTFDSGTCSRLGGTVHCTAETAGAHAITASFNGVTRTYPVAVSAGAITSIALDPVADTIAGHAVIGAVTGYDAFYNVRSDAQGLATITVTGAGCAVRTCTTAGAATVHAAIGAATAEQPVTIAPAAPQHLEVTGPDTTFAGAPVEYAVEAFDAYGNSRGDVTASTTLTVGGSACPLGVCTATVATPAAGPGVEIAASHTADGATAVGSRTVAVLPGPLAVLAVTPLTTGVAAGTPVSFTATGADTYGNTWGDVTSHASFTIDGAPCTGATCTPTLVGAHTVAASIGDGHLGLPVTGLATITVTPAAAHHVVVATDAATHSADESFTASAVAFDVHGNRIGDVTASTDFTIAGGSCVLATCTRTTAGASIAVSGTWNALADDTTVSVTPAPADRLALDTDAATSVAGGAHTYVVNAFDRFGNAIGDVTANATFTFAPDGSCTAGACGSTQAGPHALHVTYAGVATTGTQLVTPAPLHAITAAPVAATITAGGSTAITVTPLDTYGNVRSDDVATAVVTIDGEPCPASDCTSTDAGQRDIHVVYGTLEADTHVQVDPATLASVEVTPSATSVVAGASVTFATVRRDTYGNDRGTADGVATFDLDGATCTGAACTLTRAGQRTITATVGARTGAAHVDVTAASVDSIEASIDDAQVVANGSSTTTVRVAAIDAFGNPAPSSTPVFSISPATGAPVIGALVADGVGAWKALVTSSATRGTWTITATDASVTPAEVDTVELRQVAGGAAAVAFVSAAPTLVADGVSAADVDLHVSDATGHPVEGAHVSVTSSGAQVIGAVSGLGDGDYRAQLTSSTVAGTSELTVSVTGIATPITRTITQVPGAPARISLTASATSIVADGAAAATITAVTFDAHDNEVGDTRADVTWAVGAGAAIASGTRVGARSVATLTATAAGTATVHATAGAAAASLDVTVTALPVAPPAVPPAAPTAPTTKPVALTPAAVTQIVALPTAALALTGATPDRASLPIECPETSTTGCRGSVTVRATNNGGAVLGTGTVRVAVGASSQLVVRLTAAGRAALAAAGRVKVTVEVAVSNGAGTPVTVKRTVWIVAAPFAGVKLTSTGRVDSARKLAVQVSCPAAAVTSCTGTIELTRVVDGARVRIASAPFTVAHGAQQRVLIEVTEFSWQAAQAARGVGAQLTARARDARPATRIATRSVVLRS